MFIQNSAQMADMEKDPGQQRAAFVLWDTLPVASLHLEAPSLRAAHSEEEESKVYGLHPMGHPWLPIFYLLSQGTSSFTVCSLSLARWPSKRIVGSILSGLSQIQLPSVPLASE